MKPESYKKMLGHLIDMTCITTTELSGQLSMGQSASTVSAHSTQSHMPRGYADSQLTSTVSTHTLEMLPRLAFRE